MCGIKLTTSHAMHLCHIMSVKTSKHCPSVFFMQAAELVKELQQGVFSPFRYTLLKDIYIQNRVER